MPGDPRECRARATRCEELAKTAENPEHARAHPPRTAVAAIGASAGAAASHTERAQAHYQEAVNVPLPVPMAAQSRDGTGPFHPAWSLLLFTVAPFQF
jgi:hypothetical protein